MTALYILADEYRAAAAALADTDLDDQTIADTLDGLSGDLEVKATNVAMFARNLESTAEAIKEAESDMASRRKALESRADGLRRYLLTCMQRTGIREISCPQFKLSIKANPPAVDVFDAAQIPAEFMRQPEPPPPSPDKTAIKAALKAGASVPGARMTQGERLYIK